MRSSSVPATPEGAPGHPVLIELVGPPGSGKSAVARSLRQAGDDVLPAARPRQAIGWGGLLRSGLVGTVHFAPQLPRVPTRPGYRLSVLVQLLAHAELVRGWQGRGAIGVLDQGPVYLLSILQRALRNDGRDSRRYLRFWGETLQHWADTLRMIVLLDAPDYLLLARMRGRGTPHPFLARGPEGTRHALVADRRSRDEILDALTKRNPTLRVLRLDSAADAPGGLAQRIMDELAQGAASVSPGGPARDPSAAGSRR